MLQFFSEAEGRPAGLLVSFHVYTALLTSGFQTTFKVCIPTLAMGGQEGEVTRSAPHIAAGRNQLLSQAPKPNNLHSALCRKALQCCELGAAGQDR